MSGFDLSKLRFGLLTFFFYKAAARLEAAAAREIGRVGNEALDSLQSLSFSPHAGERIKESYCIRMFWIREQRAGGGVFDYLPRIHDGHIIGSLRDDAQVMSYEER